MLLLHSLAEFWPIIETLLGLSDAKAIAEIGAEYATTTRMLCAWAAEHGARVTSIEPSPSPALLSLAAEYPCLEVVPKTSLDALATLVRQDIYLLDGDHNYHTVTNELRLISEAADESSMVLLHDVGWPCAHRDMYYDPDSIPAESRHDYTYFHGVIPGNPGVIARGFRSEGQYAIALQEGGERNGVLTAVRDHLAKNAESGLYIIPCIFGLGVLLHPKARNYDQIAAYLSFYSDNPLIARLEENRLALYLKVLDLQDQLSAGLAQSDQLRTVIEDVHATRSWRTIERWWRLKARAFPPGSTRARLYTWLRDRVLRVRR